MALSPFTEWLVGQFLAERHPIRRNILRQYLDDLREPLITTSKPIWQRSPESAVHTSHLAPAPQAPKTTQLEATSLRVRQALIGKMPVPLENLPPDNPNSYTLARPSPTVKTRSRARSTVSTGGPVAFE